MKSTLCVIAILGVLGAAPAVAATSHAKPGPRASAARAPHRLTRVSHRRPATRRRPIIRAHMSALAAADAKARAQHVSLAEQDTGPSEAPSWFKTKDKAGYGWREGGTETMVGVYRRPTEPDLPGPRIAPEAKGAAGVSFALKLGG